MNDNDHLTVTEVALLVRASERTVLRWIAAGRLVGVLVGPRRKLVAKAEIDRFLGRTTSRPG